MSAPDRKILIGVHVASIAQTVEQTLLALYQTASPAFDIRLLVDACPGEENDLAARLAPFNPRLLRPVSAPGGGAAAFNSLIAEPADRYVYLEAGAQPAPGWLEALTAALDADPAHGLAGPSTSLGWNIQAGPADRGEGWTILAPLEGPCDVCFAVRRETVEAVGAADEAYGRGPCWELDYGVRAARAGYASLWVKEAYVERAPLTPQRLAAETERLQFNKRLFQDRFCSLRMSAPRKRAPYHDSCKGEACARFAPADRIKIHRRRPKRLVPPAAPAPLISCVMPTRGRARFVVQAIAYFQRQDYPNRELIIIYDQPDDLPEADPTLAAVGDPRIRAIRATDPSIGAKRNQGAAIARGEILVHWDDDDWYASDRLSRQARPIIDGAADITGLNDILFLSLADGEVWSATPHLFAQLFVGAVSGGSLAFRRQVWTTSGPYPSTSLREDADFLTAALQRDARLCRLPGRDLCIYVRHDRNTWRFAEGRHLDPAGWSREAEPARLQADRSFYGLDRPKTAEIVVLRGQDLVSCIMPTANRRDFAPRAIEAFLKQDYEPRELLILDDGKDSLADLVPASPMIRYLRLERRLSLGAKRNLACDLAHGDFIAHWDDDDWMASGWLQSQLNCLKRGDAEVGGLDKVFFYAPATRQAWRYVYDGDQPWACGGTLIYTKDLWRRVRFQDVNVGEDTLFVWDPAVKRLAVNARHDLYVATVHARNTSPKLTTSRRWRSFPAAQLEQMMREDEGRSARIARPSSSRRLGGPR